MLRKVLIIVLAISILLSALFVGAAVPMWCHEVAYRDVMNEIRKTAVPGRPPLITSTRMRFSFSHGIKVMCRVRDAGEISFVVWYLWPWRKMIAGK